MNQSLLTTNYPNSTFISSSSIVTSDFPYIIPYGTVQTCDIYGPLCQTGSITVAVNLTTGTSRTTLPCSSYLTAQAYHLLLDKEYADNGVGIINWPETWGNNFGRSPQCRSFAQFNDTATFSNCGANNSVHHGDYNTELPPGVIRRFDPVNTGTCCGFCTLNISEIRLYYFPDDHGPECHHNGSLSLTSTAPASGLSKRLHSLVADGSVAIVSGHTL